MKKKLNYYGFKPIGNCQKLLRTMKITTFLLFCGLINLAAEQGYSQNTKISINLKGATIESVLNKIEDMSEFYFLYNEKLIDVDRKVDLDVKNQPIKDVLNQIFTENVSFIVSDRQIVLTPSKDEMEIRNALQQVKVTGTVTDASTGEAITGANVLVEGTTLGVISDVSGNFSIDVPNNNVTLLVSFVGYNTERVSLNGQSVIDVKLIADITKLDEIVVIGYGSINKKNVTGNQSVIKSDQIKSIPTSSIDAALQGKGTGIDISSAAGGQINGLVKVRIRGSGSINSSTQPLWVVDGIPVMADEGGSRSQSGTNVNATTVTPSVNYLADLNFNDVESVSVLKDAAATAIYGSRGANGVILITTKTGKQGKGKLDFDYKRTFSNAINQIELVEAKDWIQMNQKAWENDGRTGEFPLPINALWDVKDANGNPVYTRDIMNSSNTNWMDKMFRTGVTDEYSLSMSNGTEKAAYYISGNYSDITGIMVGQNVKKFSVRANLDIQPVKWLKTGVKATYGGSDGDDTPVNTRSGGKMLGAPVGQIQNPGYLNAFNLPVYPEKYADGSVFEPVGLNAPNMIKNKSLYVNEYNTQHLVGMTFIELELFKGLTFRTELGMDYFRQDAHNFGGKQSKGGDATTYRQTTNYVKEGYDASQKVNYNAVLNYSKILAGIHNLNVTMGAERTSTMYRFAYMQNWNVLSSNQYIGLTPIDYDVKGPSRYRSDIFEERFEGFFGRINYSLKDKYLLGFSIRRDGSNKFGPDSRFGIFPSVSAGWVISDESFFPKEKVNMLKLRASYGQTGNSNIAMNMWRDLYSGYAYYNDEQWNMLITLGNKSIQWEKSNVADFGLEFGLLNNRISGSVSYYNKSTSNMLLNSNPPPSVPAGWNPSGRSIVTNAGNILNSGFEFSLSSTNIDKGSFRWVTDFNFSTNKNEIVALDKSFAATPFSISNDTRIAIMEGHPLGEYVLTQFAGYTDKGDDMIYLVDQELRTKSNQYELVSTGKSEMATSSNMAANRFFTGKTGIPKFYGGINNSFSYKGLTLDIFFNFRGGHYILMNGTYTSAGESAINADLVDKTWTSSNTNAKYPRLSYNNLAIKGDGTYVARGGAEDRYLVKGDFIRLKDLRLGYSFPSAIIEKAKLKSLMVYVDVQNLVTLSHMPYYDPEVSNNLKVSTTSEGSNIAGALNYAPSVMSGTPFPNVRTVQFGVKLGL